MATEVKVPELPESVSEATVGEWQKKQGDAVERDENLLDLETDKVVLEVPAVAAGKLVEIKVEAGDTVQAGDVLAVIEEGAAGDADYDDSDEDADADAADDKEEKKDDKKKDKSDSASAKRDDGDDDSDDDAEEGDADAVASPAAKKLMAENDLAAADIKGSGKDGRITKADVQSAVESKPAKKSGDDKKAAQKKAPEEADTGRADRQALGDVGGERVEQRVPMTRIRSRIAERLLDASQNTAMLTTFNEVDMKAVMELRGRYKEAFEKEHEVRLGFMSFFVKAAVEALKRYPIVNASIDDGDIVYHGFYDVGVAVSSPRGLLVPVLRDADQMSYATVESTIRDLGKRAQDGKVTMDEMTGGTFTITNGGVFGSLLSTPIINPPQSAILGMHATNDKPVVRDGEIVIRPIMQLALSYDHRLVDGRDAVLFLKTIKDLLEDPSRLLLQI